MRGEKLRRSSVGGSDGGGDDHDHDRVVAATAHAPRAGRVGRAAVPQRAVQAAGRQAAGDVAQGRGHRRRGRGRVRGRPAVPVRRPGRHMLPAVAVARPEDRRAAEKHARLSDGQTARLGVLQPIPLEQTVRDR